MRLRDTMAAAPGQRGHDLGYEAPHEVLRDLEGVSGTVEVELECALRAEYGLVRPLLRVTDAGAQTFGAQPLELTSPVALSEDGGTLRARFRMTEGERVGFALRWSSGEERERPETTPPGEVAARVDDTAAAWRSWDEQHDVYDGSYRALVRRSTLVLKGLTYRPTGAIIAAPTTSLPETVGGTRNWDYRFSWIRDASLTVDALHVGACSDEVEEFVSFMTSSAGGRAGEHSLQIMYGIGGEHDLTERELPFLRGWRDSAPVRVGNGAWDQDQLDVYGELLGSLWRYHERLGELHPEIQAFVAGLADTAAARWTERDAGMWEMRGEPLHHVSSKVMCWVALDRAVRLAGDLGEHARPEEWARTRDEIREAILTRGWNGERGAFVQSFDGDALDAAALLMPLVDFLPADDDRMRSTMEAIADELSEDGLVRRYLAEEGPNADGLEGEEGTFVICSFWLVACLARAGEVDRAEELFARLTGFANELGLLAEEIDPASGEQLGNFPQAFSHVGLITAAHAIDEARGTSG